VSGDTLWGISQKNKVSVKDLLTINGMKENSVLKIGKVLKIPAR
jgi:LysM repeat protein